MYTLRFWNKANECIEVGGRYSHDFDTKDDAFNVAYALIKSAHKKGAVEIDIDNEFYSIIED